jgi:hypothetical protein
LFAEQKPLDDTPVFFRWQALYGRLDLLNSAHSWSLSPPGAGFHPVPKSRPAKPLGRKNALLAELDRLVGERMRRVAGDLLFEDD